MSKYHKKHAIIIGGASMTEIYRAITSNNVTQISKWVAQGIDFNRVMSNRATPLYTASQTGYTEVVKMLLTSQGIDVNTDATDQSTPLYIASKEGHTEIVALLLAAPGIDVNKANVSDTTPLRIASYSGHVEIVVLLLAAPGIDINKESISGITPLYTASQEGHTEIVALLLAAPGIDVNKTNVSNITPLCIASYSGHVEIVVLLLAVPGIDINKESTSGTTPLYTASHKKHTEIVALLLAAPGIDVNKANEDGITPLCAISQMGYTDIVALLLAAPGIDVNKATTFQITPLYTASQEGKNEVVTLLLASPGIDVNKSNRYGATPLYITSQEGNTDIVALLLAAPGIDVNKAIEEGITPLCVISQMGYTDIVSLLLGAPGIDVNKATKDGVTPLYISSLEGNTDTVALLLAAPGIDVNKASIDGISPLHSASGNGNTGIVKMLLNVPTIQIDAEIRNNLHSFLHRIQTLIKAHIQMSLPVLPLSLWPGFSKNDSEKLGLLFEEKIGANTLGSPIENEVLYSHCPICLKYISHDEATCMYMSHNCEELGGYYHKDLFDRYKHQKLNIVGVPTGTFVITWCTLCGRICQGHQHYALDSYTAQSPRLLKSGALYETDCRKTNSGGGWPEKAERHRRLRKYALELNEQVGKLTTEDALNQLVKEMWNAPLQRKGRALHKMETERVFNIEHNEFPTLPYNQFPNIQPVASKNASLSNNVFKVKNKTFRVKNNMLYTNNAKTRKANAPYQYYYERYKKANTSGRPAVNVPYPNTGTPELHPIVHQEVPAGFVDPTHSGDEENIVQCRHRRSDGTINRHTNPATDMIGKDMLLLQIDSAIQNGQQSKIGPCWQDGCTAKLYPQELKHILEVSNYTDAVQKATDMTIYEKYRYEFNKKYA